MDPFIQLSYPYAQKAVLELLFLTVVAGALGPWVILRGLAFFAHAVGTAAFPGLVAADALAIAPQIGAAASATIVSAGAGVINPSDRNGTRTALWLTGSLAVGALVASDMGQGAAGVDSALFGSLLATSTGDLVLAGVAAVLALKAAVIAGPRWLSGGLLGRDVKRWDSLLLLLVALAAIAQLAACGALLASALLVLPAVAARPWVTRLPAWHLLTGFMAGLAAFGGLLIALSLDTPPGAAIAVCAGGLVAVSRIAHAGKRRPHRRLAAALTASLAVVLGGCGTGGQIAQAVATTPIVGDLVQSIAGKELQVKTLIPAGADPHEYEPKPSDIQALADTKVLFTSGSGMDTWASGLLSKAGGSARTVDLGASAPVKLAGTKPGEVDPHWFHDPANVAAAAGVIASALSAAYPAQANVFHARARVFAARALSLGAKARLCIERLTPSERMLVTDHDAFAYLAKSTGLHVVGTVIPSQSTASAPSARGLDRLAGQIKQLHVRAIFPERSVDPRLAKALATETGASSKTQLDGDTLGPTSSSASTWSGMWAGNVQRLTSALSGGRVNCQLGARS